MEIHKIILEDKIFLLNVDEVEELPIKYLKCKSWWWLRSPGYFQYSTAFVFSNGSLNDGGLYVGFEESGVRPAILLDGSENIESWNGDIVNYLGVEWVDISKYLGEPILLAVNPIAYKRFDGKSNIYETSEIRKFLLKWLEEKRKSNS